jgi:hypothetical protein
MLRPVLFSKPEGYPVWMRSESWNKKDLITALSSWAQLRHDTVLYVKQSYTGVIPVKSTSFKPEPMGAKYYGYVEPNPGLFARAAYLTDYLLQWLSCIDLLTDTLRNVLKTSSDMMQRLATLSTKELKGKGLVEADYDYIENIDERFKSLIKKLASASNINSEKQRDKGKFFGVKSIIKGEDSFNSAVITDIHTETNTKNVLEAGTGRIDWLLVAHRSKDGRIGLAVGPVFSYYEFPWPMDDRLTNDKWRENVMDKTQRPEWNE